MEKDLMEQFVEILKNEDKINDIDLYYDDEGNWVISYEYNSQKYIINIMELNEI